MPDGKHLSIFHSPHIQEVKKNTMGSKLKKVHDAVPLFIKYSTLALKTL